MEAPIETSMVLVIPQNDEREHVEDVYCWCEPRIEREDKHGEKYPCGPLVIHNSADCRELVEQAILKAGDNPREPGKSWLVIPL